MPKPAEIFNATWTEPVFSSLNHGRRDWTSTYTIYPLFLLDELIRKVRARKTPIDAIRYLVDTNKQLWFAEEGCASAIIPAHYQMTGNPASSARCIAAGNIIFSADYKNIIAINHKSGDFRPGFDSIRWPLAILIAHERVLASFSMKINSTLVLEQLTSTGGVEATYPLDKDELGAWLMSTLDEKTMRILGTIQPHALKTVSYEAPTCLSIPRRGPFFADSTTPRSLGFEVMGEIVPRKLTFSDL